MEFGIERLFEVSPWEIIHTDFSLPKNELVESIFSLANEYMGTRGLLEEGLPEEYSLEGCYIGGIFAKESIAYNWKRRGFPSYQNSMIHTTNWLRLSVNIDGETFSMTASGTSGYRRTLDMKRGILSREVVFETTTGKRTRLHWERFVSHADLHLGAVRLSVTPLNHNAAIEVAASLDSRRENKECAIARRHVREHAKACRDGDCHLLMNVDSTGQYYIHRMLLQTGDLTIRDAAFEAGDRIITQSFAFDGQEGVTATIDKLVSVWTSREKGYPFGLISKSRSDMDVNPALEKEITAFLENESKAHLSPYAEEGAYETAREAHVDAMVSMWEFQDIEIEGDDESQQGIRYCMFQLLNTYRGNDPWLNIGAKGLTGEHYNGRTFWDSESYCLPYYLFTNPDAARNLLEYRYNTLKASRERAAELGLKGACYAWTTMDGTEDCALFQYYNEIHINAIVPFAIYYHRLLTGDTAYSLDKGLEVLVETSRFWASRVAYIPHREGYAINRVTGPDEQQQFVNNNYYTNYMAKWSLGYTLGMLDELSTANPAAYEAFCQRLGLTGEERATFAEVSAKMLLPYSEDYGVMLQDDMFLDLDPRFREEITRQEQPIERSWTIEKFLASDLVKQPDVLLLFFLFRERFTLEEKAANYRFYEQRTIHGSSLSPSIHSILASEVGRYEQALFYFLWTSRCDLDNCNNNTHYGLHVSSMSGTWLNIVYGFGGLQVGEQGLKFAPAIPSRWSQFSFKINYRGRIIKVTVDREQTRCRLLKGEAIDIEVHGHQVCLGTEPSSTPHPGYLIRRPELQAAIFDLDGVITDTAEFHYQAWKKIADKEGIYFDKVINERLKGVSRMESLRIIIERSDRDYSDEELEALATEKNDYYKTLLGSLTPDHVLEGIPELLQELKEAGILVGVCSASRNTPAILEKLGLAETFKEVVTGNDTAQSKPHPEGMFLAAERLGVEPCDCVVIEDAYAGVEAARSAGMKSMGIGQKLTLHNADYVLPGTRYLSLNKLNLLF
ncbi:MAG: beta-phosphoglucomutase [Puniceicoccaceae bacterium]